MSLKRCLFSAFVILLLASACKKERIERRYTGNFIFTDHKVEWDINYGTTLDTVITNHGTITIYTGQATSEQNNRNPVFLNIQYGSGHTVIETDKKGQFYTDHRLHGEASGAFTDYDHLQFHDSDGGQGFSYSHDVTAVRE
jgi:hypothetical protein